MIKLSTAQVVISLCELLQEDFDLHQVFQESTTNLQCRFYTPADPQKTVENVGIISCLMKMCAL